ncbi:MAG: rane fusion protein Cu(I)/Ag(I) efflux system [Segetibacter sp.]|nr:rane fusion protein Cu(I)/Ag(I) efflux system [Segetibacter sp.]
MKKILFIATILLSMGFVFTACSGNDNKSTSAQLAKDEMYTCTMHNEVMSDHPGECPKCGMKLVKQKMTAEQQKMMNEGTYVKHKE